MDVQILANKLLDVEKQTSAEKGRYLFFALFKNKESVRKWEIYVAADWINYNPADAKMYLMEKVKEVLTPEEQFNIAGFRVFGSNDAELKAFQQMFSVEHMMMQMQNCNMNGVHIDHAFIITSLQKTFNPQSN